MKLKTILASILTCGLVAGSASAQSSLVDSTSSAKARTALTDLASVKLVSSVTSNGKEILVLPSGQKVPATLAQKPAKALETSALSKAATKVKAAKAGSVVSSAVIVSSDARMGLAPGQIVVIGKTGAKTSTTAITLADAVIVAPAAPASIGPSANPLAAANVGTPLNVPLHPTQLYESAAEAIILLVLLVSERKGRAYPGRTFWLYMLMYGVSRFIIEFYRGDQRGMVFDALSTSQFISLILVPLSLVMLAWLARQPQPTRERTRKVATRAS